jgi:hypothetical protein
MVLLIWYVQRHEPLIRFRWCEGGKGLTLLPFSQQTAAQIGFKDLDVSLRAIHHRANQLVNALHDIEQVTPVDVDDDDSSVQVISPPKSSIKRQSLDGLDSPAPTDKKMRASY